MRSYLENLRYSIKDLIKLFKPQLLPFIIWAIAIIYVFVPTKKSFNAAGRKWMYSMF
jgi:hypothetical protein